MGAEVRELRVAEGLVLVEPISQAVVEVVHQVRRRAVGDGPERGQRGGGTCGPHPKLEADEPLSVAAPAVGR